MPIATGLEREELEAELQVRAHLVRNLPVIPAAFDVGFDAFSPGEEAVRHGSSRRPLRY
jgi:pyrroline-5-carboxylate reductase